ncbi:MAG: hypothetical protein KGK08_11995 [Acidobacteriota bacterium]|nr:hypothetical protein [Acidobacteriota bacterium]
MRTTRSNVFLSLVPAMVIAAALLFCITAAYAAEPAADGGVTASGASNGAGPIGLIPQQRGFNASLVTASEHDSSNGWSNLETPGIAYRFNRHFSVNAAVPVYAYVNVLQNTGTKAKPVYSQRVKTGVLGDTALAAQFVTSGSLSYMATFTLGLPTGNSNFGLGAGKPTVDLNNHFEKDFGNFTPDIELGIGDSSALISSRIRKSYTAVGAIAHFQAGTSYSLPANMSLEIDAYEQLPVAPSTIYSTTGKGAKRVTKALGPSASEDNGFLTSLDIPVQRHITLSGEYSRSLRDHDDIAGFSLTFLLVAPATEEELLR